MVDSVTWNSSYFLTDNRTIWANPLAVCMSGGGSIKPTSTIPAVRVADSDGSDNRTVGPTRSLAHGSAAGRTLRLAANYTTFRRFKQN
jgi:hypothetical protein